MDKYAPVTVGSEAAQGSVNSHVSLQPQEAFLQVELTSVNSDGQQDLVCTSGSQPDASCFYHNGGNGFVVEKVEAIASPAKTSRRGLITCIVMVLAAVGIIIWQVALPKHSSSSSSSSTSSDDDLWVSLESNLGATLPSATKSSIDSLVISSNDRVASYVSANVVMSVISVLKTNNVSSLYADISTMRDDLMRAAECAVYMSDGNYTNALTLLSTASYSVISSEEDAIAYLAASNASVPISVTLVSRNTTQYSTSCDYLINKQLGTTSESVSGRRRLASLVFPSIHDTRVEEGPHLRGSVADAGLALYSNDDNSSASYSYSDDDISSEYSYSNDDISSESYSSSSSQNTSSDSSNDDYGSSFTSSSNSETSLSPSSNDDDNVTFVPSSYTQNDIDLIFVNGICATPKDMAAAATALNVIIQQQHYSKSVSVETFATPSNSWFCAFALLEILQKKVEEEGGTQTYTIADVVKFIESWPIVRTAGILGDSDTMAILKAKLSPIYSLPYIETVLQSFSDSLANKLTEFEDEDDTAYKLADKIANSVFHGKAVIVVSHSQGNFYMNLAYQSLSPNVKPYVKLVSVASPADYVGNTGTYAPYVTRTDDKVINSLRLVSSALAGNVIGSRSSWFGLNHYFLSDYLEDDNAKARLVSSIATLVDLVEQSPAQGAPITITMTWGATPDLDLHIYEPNGFHVYYSQKTGYSGYLDVDDTTSYGPENYFVGASTLELGTYLIGVNYYAGSLPDNAHFYIQTSTSVREYDQPVYTSVGYAGNDHPIMVAKVIVSMDQHSNSPSFLIEAI